MDIMAFPVLDDKALDAYHRQHKRMKRRSEPEASKIAPGVLDASLQPPWATVGVHVYACGGGNGANECPSLGSRLLRSSDHVVSRFSYEFCIFVKRPAVVVEIKTGGQLLARTGHLCQHRNPCLDIRHE